VGEAVKSTTGGGLCSFRKTEDRLAEPFPRASMIPQLINDRRLKEQEHHAVSGRPQRIAERPGGSVFLVAS
jgi:hypothetical protein